MLIIPEVRTIFAHTIRFPKRRPQSLVSYHTSMDDAKMQIKMAKVKKYDS